MSTSLHAGRIGARPAMESVTTIVWVSGTQEARPAAVVARVDRDRDRSAGSNFRTCSVFPLASLTMPFVFPHHCLNFTNPCSQMALPGLGLIPPPYAFDAAGNIVPTPLMCRAALIGNLIGRIVRVSHTTFSAAVDDEPGGSSSSSVAELPSLSSAIWATVRKRWQAGSGSRTLPR